ncbi:MAG: glycosyltransferase family 2 protein [Ruminococcaceae bacterium]|nr:glycosyltransferase family 2 protein [Oscillospiraceae bacterium]
MISLVIPAYNEEKRIGKTLEVFYEYMNRTFSDFEIVAVNDGSKDRTVDVLEMYKEKMPRLKVLTYEKNRGKGGAVKYGVENAIGDYIFFTDADMPYPIENVEHAVDILEKTGADAVLGKRKQIKNGEKYPWYRNVISKGFSFLVNIVLKINTTDTQCGFKGFKKETAEKIFSKSRLTGWGFDVEIFFLASKYEMKTERIEVELFHDNDGSKISVVTDSIKMFKELIKVRKNNKLGLYD